ncbi:MAG: hypothetical protein H0V89_10830 [Deltaproteobacteria bacterium]|nr:hypothetical protein [Deltaproteobacteria bacterium]
MDELATLIRNLVTTRDLAQTLEVGELLYTRCYGSTGPGTADSPTINALAPRLADLRMSRATLYRAVQVYLQHGNMAADVRDDLSLSQHYGVSTLPDGPEKDDIARAAVEAGASARDVVKQVKQVRAAAAPRAQPAGSKAAIPPLATVRSLLEPWLTVTASTRPPTAGDAERLLADLDLIEDVLTELRPWLVRGAGR